jgi:hypothetical protein
MSALGRTVTVSAMARRPLGPVEPDGRGPPAAHRQPRDRFAFARDANAGIVEACSDRCKHGLRTQAHAISNEPLAVSGVRG